MNDGMFLNRRILVSSALALAGLALPVAASPEVAGDAVVSRELRAHAPSLGERSLGSPEARVVVIEYASLTCPHCAQFHIRSLPQIRKTYIETGKVLWIFREFPLDELAMAASMLARCLPEDGYFPALDVLFREQKTWTGPEPRKELTRLMLAAGMGQQAFDACIARSDLADAIYNIAKTGQQFGVKSTPTFFVNGLVVRGAQEFAAFKEILERELSK
jgi:protein-disulfide isomerase